MNTILVQKDFSNIEERFAQLTDIKTFKREISFAMQHISKSAQLQKCDKNSLISAVLNVANFGLSLNPIKKEAYIVPRYDRQSGMIAYLEPSYQGLIKSVTEHGGVLAIAAHVVYQGDEFIYENGLETILKHVPKYKSKVVTHAFAVATLAGGIKQPEVMEITELNEIRDTSTSWKAFKDGKISSCIWKTWPNEMYRKTVIRRMCKYLPKGNNDRLAELVAADETDYQPSFSAVTYAESLINTSVYDDERKAHFEAELLTMNRAELDNLITDLQDNQIPAMEMVNPNQTDIGKAISAKMDDPKA